MQVALEHAKTLHTSSANDSLLKNCLAIDLFSLESLRNEEQLIHLAKLADTCNLFFQSKQHAWHYGADGPVFGIHASESIPHLRAYCRYGPSVQDGWMAVRYLVELLKSLASDNETYKVAASVWDVQDGQLILIQLADLLPSWLDEDSTDNHRYACWIDQKGHLQLFRKRHILLSDALQELRKERKSSSHPKMQEALDYWLDLNDEAASLRQRTPMVLPRKVALAFRERPELLHTAIQAFCEHVQQDGPVAKASLELDFTKYENWVWTIQSLSRTNYAMARTVCSTNGDWTSSPDSVPPNVGVEVKRYRRQCKSEASKHLKHAVALGLRAVAGLQLLLAATSKNNHGIFATSAPLSSLEERIIFWDRVQQTIHTNTDDKARTILESFQMGPNKATIDLTHVLKCPVFPEEAHNWTSYTNPQSSLRDQIKSILRSKSKESEDSDEEGFWVPQPDQVDGEDWMDCGPGTRNDDVADIDSQQGLDDLLSRFQSFLHRSSGVEGISSNEGTNAEASTQLQIRPRVFLNILHAALKGEKLHFPKSDPYFYQEDYDLAQGEGDSDSDSDNDDEGAFRMNDLMVAMDKELEARTESRKIPPSNIESLEINSQNKDSVDADAHVLNNLLESLDASGGGSGPVINILKEMEGSS